MATPNQASFDDISNNEFIDDSLKMFPITVIIAVIVVLATMIILWWQRRGGKGRGEGLLLCGISNSGKTLLFCRLTKGFAQRTLTSMAVNRDMMQLEGTSNRSQKKVPVIDIPGSLRIRQRDFNANKSSAKAMIFVVDSTAIKTESKDVADYLYDILSEKLFRQQRLPLLIFCNKQDMSNESENIQSIRRLLENELTMKRKTRAASVDVHQGKTETSDDIGQAGKETFEFNDIKDIKVEFVDGSALGNERKAFAGKYDDDDEENNDDEQENLIDSAGDETDGDTGANLNKVYDWIEKIWAK